jgi:hypothetical protein
MIQYIVLSFFECSNTQSSILIGEKYDIKNIFYHNQKRVKKPHWLPLLAVWYAAPSQRYFVAPTIFRWQGKRIMPVQAGNDDMSMRVFTEDCVQFLVHSFCVSGFFACEGRHKTCAAGFLHAQEDTRRVRQDFLRVQENNDERSGIVCARTKLQDPCCGIFTCAGRYQTDAPGWVARR